MKLEWIKKPYLISKTFSKVSHEKVEKQVSFYSEFQKNQADAILHSMSNESVTEDYLVDTLLPPGPSTPVAPATKDTLCSSLYVGAGTLAVLTIAAGFKCMRRRAAKKPAELRDVDLPLHNNELNHYSLYID